MAKQIGIAVGIDIGSKFIKVAEVKAGRPPVLTSLGIAPTPEGAVDAGGIINPSAVAAALKKLLAESGISTKQAIFSLAGQNSVVTRILEVPKMNMADLKQHMDWEVQRNIPFADTRVQSAYEVINRPDDDPADQNMDVVLAVAQQDAIDNLIEIADVSGMEPFAIDVEPLAVGRSLLESQNDMRSRNVVVVNVGASVTTIDIFDMGLLVFPRILPTIGGDVFTRAIGDFLAIPDEEAEKLKTQHLEILLNQAAAAPNPFGGSDYGAYDSGGGATIPPADGGYSDPNAAPYNPGAAYEEEPPPYAPITAADSDAPPSPFEEPAPAPSPFDTPAAAPLPAQSTEADMRKQQLFQAVSPLVEELVSELRRSVEYHLGRKADARIDLILLCGGAGLVPNLDQLIQSVTNIPTEFASPLKGLQVNTRRHGPDFVAANAHVFPVAIGMALHPFM